MSTPQQFHLRMSEPARFYSLSVFYVCILINSYFKYPTLRFSELDITILLIAFIAFIYAIHKSLIRYNINTIGIRKTNMLYHTVFEVKWEHIKEIKIFADNRIQIITFENKLLLIRAAWLKDEYLFLDYLYEYASESIQRTQKNFQSIRFEYQHSPLIFSLSLLIVIFLILVLLKNNTILSVAAYILMVFFFSLFITIVSEVENQWELQPKPKNIPEPNYIEWIKLFNSIAIFVVMLILMFFNNIFSVLDISAFLPTTISVVTTGIFLVRFIRRHEMLSLLEKINVQ